MTLPTAIPTTRPAYTPTAPKFKINANNHANIISKINALNTVNINESVPFPIAWNIFPAKTPNGMSNMKNANIRSASTKLGAKT